MLIIYINNFSSQWEKNVYQCPPAKDYQKHTFLRRSWISWYIAIMKLSQIRNHRLTQSEGVLGHGGASSGDGPLSTLDAVRKQK